MVSLVTTKWLKGVMLAILCIEGEVARRIDNERKRHH